MLANHSRRERHRPDVDSHVVVEVIKRSDDANTLLVLEADSVLVQTPKVFHSGDDRLCGVLGREHYSHW
jgi:hypothetical protein